MHLNDTFETNYQQMQACHTAVKMLKLPSDKYNNYPIIKTKTH